MKRDDMIALERHLAGNQMGKLPLDVVITRIERLGANAAEEDES